MLGQLSGPRHNSYSVTEKLVFLQCWCFVINPVDIERMQLASIFL